jgi:hypothetical protein
MPAREGLLAAIREVVVLILVVLFLLWSMRELGRRL